MISHKEMESYLLDFDDTWLDFPFGEGTSVYKVGDKMFALIGEQADPVRISLKCDPLLAEHLREQYETVLPGYHLNKKHWNTIICSGQLSEQEVHDLIVHSYHLVAG